MNRLVSILLVLYGIVAVGIPLARIDIGAMPLYFIDIIAALILISGRGHIARMYRANRSISFIILLFIATLIPTTLSEYLRMSPLEPTYLFGRTILHIFTVWSLSGYLVKETNLKKFLIGLACGALITSTIATLHSLPITGPWVRAYVFSITMLKKNYVDDVDEQLLLKSDAGVAERGDSLVGKSNVTGFVLISVLPFLIGAVRNLQFTKREKTLINLAILLSLIGILSTYSRLAYLSLGALVLGYAYFERQVFSKRLLPFIIGIGILLGIVGLQSSLFKFDFLIDKFDLTNEKYTITNDARKQAYIVPFQILYNSPVYVVRGAGRADKKLREKDKDATVLNLTKDKANAMHSVFAASIFYRGFISMLVFFYLFYKLMILSYRSIKPALRTNHKYSWMSVASLMTLVSISGPWAFDHYLVTKMSAHMMLFLLVTLIMTSLVYLRSKFQHDKTDTNEETPADKRILSRKRDPGTSILSNSRTNA